MKDATKLRVKTTSGAWVACRADDLVFGRPRGDVFLPRPYAKSRDFMSQYRRPSAPVGSAPEGCAPSPDFMTVEPAGSPQKAQNDHRPALAGARSRSGRRSPRKPLGAAFASSADWLEVGPGVVEQPYGDLLLQKQHQHFEANGSAPALALDARPGDVSPDGGLTAAICSCSCGLMVWQEAPLAARRRGANAVGRLPPRSSSGRGFAPSPDFMETYR